MKRSKIGKVILIIFLSLIIMVASYMVSYYIDKLYRYSGTASITVTFDDTETYVIPNTLETTREEALKTWPYMFTIENNGNRKGLYQIIIKDVDTSTIKREDLHYTLILDEQELKSGKLNEISDDILYTHKIDKKANQRYKIYIWSESADTTKDDIYEYQISLNAIKDGGPGF